jgi:hypothetical protein
MSDESQLRSNVPIDNRIKNDSINETIHSLFVRYHYDNMPAMFRNNTSSFQFVRISIWQTKRSVDYMEHTYVAYLFDVFLSMISNESRFSILLTFDTFETMTFVCSSDIHTIDLLIIFIMLVEQKNADVCIVHLSTTHWLDNRKHNDHNHTMVNNSVCIVLLTKVSANEHTNIVRIIFFNEIRCCCVALLLPRTSSDQKRHENKVFSNILFIHVMHNSNHIEPRAEMSTEKRLTVNLTTSYIRVA